MRIPITVEAAVLRALIPGSSFGLEIIERVKAKTKGAVKLGTGSVYPALRVLQKGGFVTITKDGPSQEHGGRPRQYYKITPAGKKMLEKQSQILTSLAS